MTSTDHAPALPEHYFRHEFGRLVSVLSRRYGVQRLELCEDAAQSALLRALQSWSRHGVPEDRGAWLYRVANHHVLDGLRHQRAAERAHERGAAAPPVLASARTAEPEPVYLETEVEDDLLRMLFVCAAPDLPPESQLALALKTLCGFSTEEIARRLFQGTEAIHKRLQRARSRLREVAGDLDTPDPAELTRRLPSVLRMLYLLFNEGYSSAAPDRLIRRELCQEAVRLTLLLVSHPVGAVPETEALLALMYLHAARLEARVDGDGGLLLLEEQDRTRWDRELLQAGLFHLRRSAQGQYFSRYHVEAAIASEHCFAPSYAETRWDQITQLYAALERFAPSPLNTLNRAIALAEWRGPEAGLALLEGLKPPAWLVVYYLWDATLGELYRRRGDLTRAQAHLSRALERAPTQAEKALIERRLRACAESS